LTAILDPAKPKANPWEPPYLEDAELLAIKSLEAGKANAGQQIIAIACIVKKIAGTYDMTFRPGGNAGARASTFAEGKAFVGQRIMEAIYRPMAARKSGDEHGTGTRDTGPIAEARRNPKPKTRPKPKIGG
jgi:hypothetical protein